MQSSEMKPFSRLRAWFCPIYRSELPKFVPLLLLSFFVGFNYSLLKTMKDTLVVVNTGGGAEILPFLKVWGIIPGALVVTMIYGWLSRRCSRETVCYAFVGGFVGFFFIFTFVIYPLGEVIHLHNFAERIRQQLPEGWNGLATMIEYWDYSLYYVIAELWSSVVLSTIFWGVANELTSLGQATRFYALFNAGLNLSSACAGQVSCWAGQHSFLPFTFQDHWRETMVNLTTLIVLAGIAILFLYRRLYCMSSTDEQLLAAIARQAEPVEKQEKTKRCGKKRDAKGIFLYLTQSKYLLGIAAIVLSYNLVINLFEVVWKDHVSRIYHSAVEFNSYMGSVTTWTGVLSFFAALFLANRIISRFGWLTGALLTPIVTSVTGLLFLGAIYAVKGDWLSFAGSIMGFSPLMMTAWIGGAQNVLSRATKFTFFDQTKEIAFIPLPNDEKNYGKAAIDGVVSRVGKSFGSLMCQLLLMFFSSIAASLNVIVGLLLVMMATWIASVIYVGREYRIKAAATLELEDAPQAPQPEEQPLFEEEEEEAEELATTSL